jgi:heptosyltransferase-2
MLNKAGILGANPRILVRSTNWIGDAVMTTPALAALRSLYPKAHISVLARPWVAPIFNEHPAVDEVILFGSPGANNTLIEKIFLSRSLKTRLFDLALLFPNSFDSALIAYLARIPRRVGYRTDGRRLLLTLPLSVPQDCGTRHEVFYYLGLTHSLQRRYSPDSAGAIPAGPPRLHINVPAEGRAAAREFSARFDPSGDAVLIGFNPGAAYGPAKCWPVERFVSLGRALVDRFPGCHILVFGTAKEETVVRSISARLGKRAHNLAGRTTLAQVMGIIGILDLLVTNDSGLMHVGAALGIPLVAVFGSTNPVTTGPWSGKSVVVRHELSCSPCLKRTCPSDFGCMKGIVVDEVLDACVVQLEGK